MEKESTAERNMVKRLLESLSAGESSTENFKAVVGLDGFVDEIVHVVDKRTDAENYKRMETIKDFGERITSFSEQSGNVELVTRRKKIGGNGPIMANAVRSLGVPTTYIGNLGFPEIDPVFSEMADKMKVYTLAEACHTDAVEFNDGKIMFGKMEPAAEITWKRIVDVVGKNNLKNVLDAADLLALVNWTMLPYMSDIWDELLDDVFPLLGSDRERFVFFDLADPQKREPDAIKRMLSQVKDFSEFYKVIFGVNEREALQLADTLELNIDVEDETEKVCAISETLAARLKAYCVVVHPIHYAVATIGGVTYRQEGPVTPRPEITTGAGDHFNAGFCTAQMLGADPQTSLLMGVCNSGFYVMNGRSANFNELTEFMGNWREDPFGKMY